MNKQKKLLPLLIAVHSLSALPCHATEYDIGSGNSFNTDGIGYEDSCYSSSNFSWCKSGVAVLIAGGIGTLIATQMQGASTHP